MTNEERLSEENSNLRVLLWEARHEQNLKGWKKQAEVYKEKVADRERVIAELTVQIKEKNIQVQEKNIQIKELKKVIREKEVVPAEGCELIQVNGKKIGSYVSQKRYLEVVNELKRLKEDANNKEVSTTDV